MTVVHTPSAASIAGLSLPYLPVRHRQIEPCGRAAAPTSGRDRSWARQTPWMTTWREADHPDIAVVLPHFPPLGSHRSELDSDRKTLGSGRGVSVREDYGG